MVTANHIVLDGVGLGVVLSELSKLYSTKVSGAMSDSQERSCVVD